MKFGVVTPVLDGRARFRACAASVRAAAAALRGGEVVHFVRESAASREPVEDYAAEFGCDYARAPDRGLYDAISAGLDAACAAGCDALAWLNADEQWLPDAPGHAQRVLESNARIGLVYGDYRLLGPDGSLRAARRELPVRRPYLRNGVNYLLSCTVFFRRSVWENSARFDLSYPRLADKKWYLGLLASGVRAALVGRYYLGVSPTKPGYEEYVVQPDLGGLAWMEGAVPTPHGAIRVSVRDGTVTVTGPAKGRGVLVWKGEKHPIAPGRTSVIHP